MMEKTKNVSTLFNKLLTVDTNDLTVRRQNYVLNTIIILTTGMCIMAFILMLFGVKFPAEQTFANILLLLVLILCFCLVRLKYPSLSSWLVLISLSLRTFALMLWFPYGAAGPALLFFFALIAAAGYLLYSMVSLFFAVITISGTLFIGWLQLAGYLEVNEQDYLTLLSYNITWFSMTTILHFIISQQYRNQFWDAIHRIKLQAQKIKYQEETQKDLADNLASKNRVLRALLASSEALTQTLAWEALLENIVSRVIEISGIENCAIYIINEKLARLERVAFRGTLPEKFKSATQYFQLGRCICGRVGKSGKSIIDSDITMNPGLECDAIRKHEIHFYACIPLKSKNSVIGVLNLLSIQTRVMSEEDISYLKALGNYAGMALENARIYQQSEKSFLKFRNLVNTLYNGIIECDLKGNVLFINPSARQTLNYEEDELLEADIFSLVHPKDMPKLSNLREKIRQGGSLSGIHLRFISKDGHIRTTITNIQSLVDDNDKIARMVLNIRDITEEKKLQEQLDSIQRLESASRLTSGISNEFNNLLSVVLNNVSILLNKSDASHPFYESLVDIKTAVDRASVLTGRLQALGKMSQFQPEVVDVNEIIHQVLENINHQIPKNIQTRVELDKNRLHVHVDSEQLKHAFKNILTNSLEAMPDSGQLAIKTEIIQARTNMARQFVIPKPGAYIHITIADTGKGMLEEVKRRAVEPFFTTKKPGTGAGLGLSIAFGYIKNHGGYLEYESDPGIGSRCHIFLPLAKPEQRKHDAAQMDLARGTETVLLVDDEDIVLKSATRLLSSLGYKVLQAEDGQQAIEIFEKQHKDIDLVILDSVMPGMNGEQVLIKMMLVDPDSKVILSSGYQMDYEEEEMRALGAMSFLSKPYNILQLSNVVRRALDS